MAAASVQPSPRALSTMTAGRIPLASNPNAANSPFRGLAPVSGKRSRAQAEISHDAYVQPPPAKRQTLDLNGENENVAPRTFTRQSQALRDAEAKLLMRRPGSNAPVTEFHKKLVAAKDKKIPTPQEDAAQRSPDGSKKTDQSLESVRQWQRHYRRAFPQFVFYFDSVPEETRLKYSRMIQSLGAKEEKFFSRSVTHVVTTRPVPSEKDVNVGDFRHDGKVKLDQHHKTIDPSLLNRQPQNNGVVNGAMQRTTNLLDSLQSRGQNGLSQASSMDARRSNAQKSDVLLKARELQIKIWALEKLQRMMNTMFTSDTGEQASQPLTRSHATQNLADKSKKEADLQRMLQHEKMTGPADRDKSVAGQDMIQLRGFYIYVHDMDEKTRPTMVRDYPKVTDKDEGKWPQFRLSAIGRCPFLEDPNYAKRMAAEEKRQSELLHKQQLAESVPRTRTRSAAEMNLPVKQNVLIERQPNLRRSPRKQPVEELAKPLDPPKLPISRQNSADMPPLFGSAQANMRGRTRYIGGEPIASGVQPSNITSAIRSRVISSTAISSTAPDARVGTSKELHALKRKVLERGATITSGQTLTSSYMNDVRAALNGESRKRRAQDTLGNICEEGDDEDAKPRKIHVTRRVKAAPPRDPKPGYCENCRDKFDDFDEHILSKKHRKFAMDQQNWGQLDELLAKLVRR